MPASARVTNFDHMMYRRATDVIVTDLARELVLLDPRNGEMFALNTTARRIWLSLPADVPRLAALIVVEFNVSVDHAYDDAAALLGQMEQAGLITRAE